MKITKKIFVLWVMLMGLSMQVMAGGSHDTHYGKVTVSATGNGTVYIGTTSTATSGKTTETWNCGGDSGNDSKTFYLFAKADDGYVFRGWTVGGESLENPYNVSLSASTTDQNNPTTKSYTATFEKKNFWDNAATAPEAGNFYIYNPFTKLFLKKTNEVTSNPLEATRFTLDAANNFSIAYDGTNYVYESEGNGSWGATNTNKWSTEQAYGYYRIKHEDPKKSGRTRYIALSSDHVSYPYQNFVEKDRLLIFIPEAKMVEYIQNTASFDAPVNLTSLIVNPGYEASTWSDGWVVDGFEDHGNEGKFSGSHIAQMWSTELVSGSIKQTLKNLPAGIYELSATVTAGFDGETYIYAGTADNKAIVNGIDGDPTQTPKVYFEVSTDGQDVEFGFVRDNARWWTACDDWTLTYYGAAVENVDHMMTGSWTGKYLYTTTNTEGQVAFGRGANWNTQAIPTNDGGILLDININEGITTIKYTDSGMYLYDADNYYMYTDWSTQAEYKKFFLTQSVDGGYKFILASNPNYAIGIGKDAIIPAYAQRDGIDANTVFDVLKLVSTNEAPVWKIADAKAKMNVSANKYGTFVAPFDVKLPSDVSAYTVESVTDRSEVILADLQDQTLVPAKTPVVLKNESAAVETTFYGIDQRVEEDGVKPYYVENGLLRGYFEDKDNEDNKLSLVGDGHTYVMQTLNERQSFYIIGQGKTYYVTKNKCYLITPEDSQDAQMIKLGFDDEDNETGLDAITVFDNDKSSVVIYDLNGRRVNKMQKGIYIINGKKIIK